MTEMKLVERHIINKNNILYKECDNICFHTKNLYNKCLYLIRQSYINDNINIMYNLHSLTKDIEEYKQLPAKVSSAVILSVQKNFKSFFKSNADYYKNKYKYKSKPKLPKYLNKDGRFFASYTNQAISKKVFKKTGKIKLSLSNIEINTKIKDFSIINCVRIIPKLDYYIIEIVYSVKENKLKRDNKRYISIDIGVNNLATITSNVFQPVIISGKPLKSINQFYNKKLSYYKSILYKRNNNKHSKKTRKLNLKRNNKIDNYLHKSSKEIINIANNNNINTIIIGYNKNWKQDINIGSKNNQNFVNIPHSRFIEILKYKCEIEGIIFLLQEESYTSKSSFLDLDEIPIYNTKNNIYNFSGKRINRGLYKSKMNKIINADVNGSYNILRKAIPNVFSNGIEDVGVHPIVIKTINY